MQAVAGREAELARRLLQGDSAAFTEFVGLFRNRLFHYTLMMCGHREDAEEVAQETLLKVFTNLAQLRDPESVKPWVFRIAKNVCHMKRRKSAFAPEQELSLEELMPSWRDDGAGRRLEIADWSAQPEELAIRGELDHLVRDAIRSLPEIYRAVLLLRDVEELSTAETASVLEIEPDAVKQRLHRARLAVRKKLDRAMRSRKDAA